MFKNLSKTSIILWNTEGGGNSLSDQNNVVKFKKRKSINIGIVVFLILFVYIVINVYLYFTKDHLSIYEVHVGTTAVDNQISALILRQEELVYSENAGYVSYFQQDGARVAKNSSIYAIGDNALYQDNSSGDAEIILTEKNIAEMRHNVRAFQDSFSNANFLSIYDFKETAQNTVLDIQNSSMISASGDTTNDNGFVSQKSGIVTYNMDNFETVTVDNVSADMFNRDTYQKTNLRTTKKISKNKPVYKIITSEKWNLVLPLTKDQYDKLTEKDSVTFTVSEDQLEMTASLELIEKGADRFAVLTMNKNMANYLGERYLDIELNFNSVEGLKIPLTSIIEKDFYEVPLDYFVRGADSTNRGLSVENYSENGDVEINFVPTDIYYEDKTYAYIDADLFVAGTSISTKNPEPYKLTKTMKLSGVYNVNLGYAVFKRIEILYQNDEYCIVSDKTSNGLSAYDQIALNAKTVIEQKIIY